MNKLDMRVDGVNLGYVIKMISDAILSRKVIRVVLSDYDEKRSLSANAQQHVWYKAISDYTGEDIKTVGCRCKRDHGLPIILSDEVYGPKYDWILNKLNYWHLSDDAQLKIIDALAITSLFNTKQHNKFRDSLQQFWNSQEPPLNIDYLIRG